MNQLKEPGGLIRSCRIWPSDQNWHLKKKGVLLIRLNSFLKETEEKLRKKTQDILQEKVKAQQTVSDFTTFKLFSRLMNFFRLFFRILNQSWGFNQK